MKHDLANIEVGETVSKIVHLFSRLCDDNFLSNAYCNIMGGFHFCTDATTYNGPRKKVPTIVNLLAMPSYMIDAISRPSCLEDCEDDWRHHP